MKLIKLALREFALPTPRTGSIEMNSGYGRAMIEGIELHQRVQQKRLEEHDDYEAEVAFSHTFERQGFQFQIDGRMDGVFDEGGETPKIEEIKSTFEVQELAKKLRYADLSHPYCLQLLSYGYIYYLQNEVIPELSFHLVSTRSRDFEDLSMTLDTKTYEEWLELRLDELVEEAIRAEKRSERRRKVAGKFPFPFEKPRSGQVELIETIEQGMREGKRMLVQAPTGLGKTVGVLYTALKDALSRGQRVVYVTPKNSQHSVAEDAVERFQDTGSSVKSLTINAKSKMCMKAEPLCNPRYCEYAKDYYEKVAKNELVQELGKKKKLSSGVFKKMAEEYEVCPFELQLDASAEADVIICDYNYVFAPRSALGRLPSLSFAQEGQPNLVVDEAHNLPSRAMDYYSPSLSTMTLEKMRDDMRALPKRMAKEAEQLLDAAIDVVKKACPPEAKKNPKGVKFEPNVDPFVELDGEIRAFLTRYLEADYEIEPGDPVLKLTFYWSQFTEGLDEIVGGTHPEFFITYQLQSYGREGGTIKVTCCDASEMLKPCYDDYDQVVAFSATLKPFDYYAQLSGLTGEKLKIAEFLSPFDAGHRKVMIIPQISTKYSERERNYNRIAETILRVVGVKPGNYFAFFPSFDFLEKTLALFLLPSGFRVFKQERYMKAAEIEAILNDLREAAQPTIVFAVQGGVFSEGVDYPGKMVIGAFIVGPPLPNFDVERETMRKYYQENYDAGFEYAYTYPAMSKAVQAAGRVIRSESDRGIIILMDSRFLDSSYAQSMPTDWFKDNPRELVSQSILKDLQDFWTNGDPESN
jgi:DNA excision repair protein ERCC-2